MSVHEYNTIVTRAKQIKAEVLEHYEIKHNKAWAYFFAKSILNPKKDIKKIKISQAKDDKTGDTFGRQVSYNQFLGMAQRFTTYVEERGKLPLYITVSPNRKMCVDDYCFMFARIIVFYNEHKRLPNSINVNSKSFVKPSEPSNEVYNYAVKKFGRTFSSLDDILEYVANNFTYEFYFDDYKSNKEVTDSKAGNCTDLLQWLCNMVEPLGYEWKCVHVSCRSSGTGHVWGKFKHKKNTDNEWVNRDIACCADNGSVRCIWCEDGYVQAYNPDWWLENLHR